MDWLTFVAEITKAVAWPGALLALLLIVRKELPLIARSLRKLKFKDVEIEFGEVAKAVASEARQTLPPPSADSILIGGPESVIARRLEAIAELSPRAAILEAWLQVEASAAEVVRNKTALPVTSTPGPLRLRDGLIEAEALDSRQVEVFEGLRKLRNEAVHVPDAQFTKEAVSTYIITALAVASYLQSIAASAQ